MAAQHEIKHPRRPAAANARRVVDFATQGVGDVLALGRYEYHSVQPALSAHCHPGALEICYLERGCQTYRVAGEEHRLVGGDLLIVPPGVMHDTGESPEDCGVLYWLILKLPAPGASLLNLSPADSAAISSRLACLPRKKIVGRPALRSSFRRLFELHDREEGPLKALSIRYQVLCCLLELLECAESGKGRALSTDVRRTMDLIQGRPQEEFSLQDLAEEAGLSLSRFKVKFKEEIGIAPREFVLRVKVESAKRALTQQNDSVTQIAVDLGFSSSQYFATVFKRFTQMTPVAFRQKHATEPFRVPVALTRAEASGFV